MFPGLEMHWFICISNIYDCGLTLMNIQIFKLCHMDLVSTAYYLLQTAVKQLVRYGPMLLGTIVD